MLEAEKTGAGRVSGERSVGEKCAGMSIRRGRGGRTGVVRGVWLTELARSENYMTTQHPAAGGATGKERG